MAERFKSICIVWPLPRDADLLLGDKKNAEAALVVTAFVSPSTEHPGKGGVLCVGWHATALREVNRGTAKMVVSDGRVVTVGTGPPADNWAWDSVATKQRGLHNEINDVVFGLVSPRRGLSLNSPPKVKERTITHSHIHQAHSLFRLSSKWCFRAGSGLIPTEEEKKKQFTQPQQWALRKSKSIVFNPSVAKFTLTPDQTPQGEYKYASCMWPTRLTTVRRLSEMSSRMNFLELMCPLSTRKIFITSALRATRGDCLNGSRIYLSDACLCLSRWIREKNPTQREADAVNLRLSYGRFLFTANFWAWLQFLRPWHGLGPSASACCASFLRRIPHHSVTTNLPDSLVVPLLCSVFRKYRAHRDKNLSCVSKSHLTLMG